MKNRNSKFIILLLLIVTFIPLELFAQTGSYFNQRDDEYRLLGLNLT